MPSISVIVPVYNVRDHVAACLDSLRAQTFTDFEAIVVDDGSTDGSGDVAAAVMAGDARFRLVRRDNGGLSAARNTGLAQAGGRYVCFVDSDDRVTPDYLQRLHDTIEETGADWVACAIRFCPPAGPGQPHSAIHGAPDLLPGVTRVDFTDWQEVVRHFPSAWNKIYRRDLIGDIRFDEGMNYEDHAFYYRYAACTDHMVCLPEPLYLQTQGRDGQITRDGSEKVFDQFAVLEQMRAIMLAADKTGAAPAFGRILTRLTFERSEAITDRARRARFLDRARAALAATGQPADDTLGVPQAWISLLEGRLPLSVVVPTDGALPALRDTLAALQAQSLRETEILVVLDEAAGADRAAVFGCGAAVPGVSVLSSGGAGVADARNRGLAAARGECVVFLDAGDTLGPQALMAWHNQLRRAGAQMGFAPMQMGAGDKPPHPGVHDRAALAPRIEPPQAFHATPEEAVLIHAHPSAKIFDRAFLLEQGLVFPPEPLSAWQMVIAAAVRAPRIVALARPPARIATTPACRTLWRAPVPAAQLARAVERIAGDLPAGLGARLFARAVWEKLNFADFPDPAALAAFEAGARAAFARFPAPGAAGLDPFIGARVRAVLGLPAEDAR